MPSLLCSCGGEITVTSEPFFGITESPEHYDEARRRRNAERGLTAKGKPYQRGPYKNSRVPKPAGERMTAREIARAERKAAGLTTRGTVPVSRGTPIKAIEARAAQAITRQRTTREAAARRQAELDAATRAHDGNAFVQICRLERERKEARDAVKIAEAKEMFIRELANQPAHKRGRPRKIK